MDIPKEELEFAKQLREKAKDGNAAFQYQVGECYYNGYGIEPNYEEAIKWLTLAAEQGDARAQCLLGVAFHIGKGVKQDYKQAVKWYKLSAEQNYWAALGNLGAVYRVGISVEQDLEKAKEYYEKALENSEKTNDYWNTATETTKKSFLEAIDNINTTLAKLTEKTAEALKAARTEIFISYAHADMAEIDYIKELEPHLTTLSRTNKITHWSDRSLKSGDKWDTEIKEAVSRAKFAVLMVSANFFASDYIWRKELAPILKSAEETGATVLWIPVNYCDYDDTGVDQYQAVISPNKPLAACDSAERAKAYMELAKRIKELSPKQKTTTS